MKQRNAIGIDPDAQGFVCAYVKHSEAKVATKGYMATDPDLKSFLKWVKGEGDVVVAIEGSNGLSKPLEKALREAGVIFYSFKPADTDKFRKAVLGQNKTNSKDAESVARYAMALEAQGKLEQYRRVWFVDMELQLLTRRHGGLNEAADRRGKSVVEAAALRLCGSVPGPWGQKPGGAVRSKCAQKPGNSQPLDLHP